MSDKEKTGGIKSLDNVSKIIETLDGKTAQKIYEIIQQAGSIKIKQKKESPKKEPNKYQDENTEAAKEQKKAATLASVFAEKLNKICPPNDLLEVFLQFAQDNSNKSQVDKFVFYLTKEIRSVVSNKINNDDKNNAVIPFLTHQSERCFSKFAEWLRDEQDELIWDRVKLCYIYFVLQHQADSQLKSLLKLTQDTGIDDFQNVIKSVIRQDSLPSALRTLIENCCAERLAKRTAENKSKDLQQKLDWANNSCENAKEKLANATSQFNEFKWQITSELSDEKQTTKRLRLEIEKLKQERQAEKEKLEADKSAAEEQARAATERLTYEESKSKTQVQSKSDELARSFTQTMQNEIAGIRTTLERVAEPEKSRIERRLENLEQKISSLTTE
jgi:hypothetical protein